MKAAITSEIRSLHVESQRELLKLPKPKTGKKIGEGSETFLESESRSFYTPTKSVRIGNVQNNDTNLSRNRTLRGNVFYQKASQCREKRKGTPVGFFNIHSVVKLQKF